MRLQLADSDTNRWLKQKLEAFLETPEMNNKFKSELRNFACTWIIQPRNLSKEIREIIVKVISDILNSGLINPFRMQFRRFERRPWQLSKRKEIG